MTYEQFARMLTLMGPSDLWTVERAARHWGVSASRARAILSSRHIHRVSGYPAQAIKAVTLRQGARTDLKTANHLVPAAQAFTMAETGAAIGETEDERARLRIFFEFLRGADETGTSALDLIVDEPALIGEHRFDALLAAAAEYISARWGRPGPLWSVSIERFLDTAWWVSDLPSARAFAIAGVPVQRVQPPHAATSGTLIYLHGGAYALGSARGYRGLAAQLAAAAGMTALVPDYTRAPHAHYPVALEEMAAVYTRLLDDGLDPKTTVIAGDSAGGGLTLALAMALRDRGIQAPAALGLICPWADLAVDIEATRPALRDPLILPSMCTEWAPRYVGSSDPRLPGISPVYGDMSGLPPIVMQTAGDDPICVDADKIETACAASKTSIEHRRFAGMWHDFHLQVSLLPEARDAIADLGARLRGHLHQSQGQPRGVVK